MQNAIESGNAFCESLHIPQNVGTFHRGEGRRDSHQAGPPRAAVRGARSRTAPDLYSGFLRHYTRTVTRKKVAGIEVASLRGLVF